MPSKTSSGPKPSKKSTSPERLSRDAFTAGMKILAAEYNRAAEPEVMSMWWRQIRHLSDDEFIGAIDAYFGGPSTFHPHPGQILALANEASFDATKTLRDEARRQESATQESTAAHDWITRLREEQEMSAAIANHLNSEMQLDRRDPVDQRLVAATIKHLMRCTCGPQLASQHVLCQTARGLAGPGRTGQLAEALDAAQHIRAGRV